MNIVSAMNNDYITSKMCTYASVGGLWAVIVNMYNPLFPSNIAKNV